MRLVQLVHPLQGRKIALVEEPQLILIKGHASLFELANLAIASGQKLSRLVKASLTPLRMNFDEVYQGKSEWQLLPAFDHPADPNSCMVSGTGLTHKASAENRNSMHDKEAESQLTDSMKMYLWGQEKGKPASDEIGIQPEWFYKGNGSILKAHGSPLSVPDFGDDGGEEPEIVAAYLNDKEGNPWRVGFATANEFSDHVMEQKNYLYLAPSKIRNCAVGPELVIDANFGGITGKVRIIREGKTVWEKVIQTGEQNMVHSLANLEYHHFKYPNHRLPGQVHIHFLGADAFSFGENTALEEGDVMEVYWEGLGRALRNRLEISRTSEKLHTVKHLD